MDLLLFYTYFSDVDKCQDNQFTCTNRQCVAFSKTCDGMNDCGDYSDEVIPCSGTYSTQAIILISNP